MAAVLLGLVDANLSDDSPSWDVSKIGGAPKWMYAETAQPVCSVCGMTTSLVAQVYCPLEGSPFHRTLYILACTNRACWNNPRSWTVLRSQSSAGSPSEPEPATHNPTHREEWGVSADDWGDGGEDNHTAASIPHQGAKAPAGQEAWCKGEEDWGSGDEEEEDLEVTLGTSSHDKVTQDKPSNGTEIEETEKNATLDSQFDQMDINKDTNGRGSEACVCLSEDVLLPQDCAISSYLNVGGVTSNSPQTDTSDLTSCKTGLRFQGRYINVIEEPCDDQIDSLSHEKKLLAQYISTQGDISEDMPVMTGKSNKRKSGESGEGYEKAVARHGDKVFQKFKKRLSRCPQQILRYSYNGSPLYLTTPSPTDVAPCTVCGAPRVFELQLMPGLVPYMTAQKHEGVLMEFGTVLVYTCSRSCWQEGTDRAITEAIILQADPDSCLFK